MICNGNLIIPPETKKIGDKKCTWWYDIPRGIAATHTKMDKIGSMVAGIFTRCRRIYNKMQKCKEFRSFTQTTPHS